MFRLGEIATGTEGIKALALAEVRCATGKRAFETKRDALDARDKANRSNRSNMRAFRCPLCDAYHLGHPRGRDRDGR